MHGQAWCPYVVARVSGWGFISTGVLVQRWGKENRHLTTWFHSCSGAACVHASKSFCLCPGAWRELSSPLALGSHRVLLSPECVTVPCQSDGGVWGRRRESLFLFSHLLKRRSSPSHHELIGSGADPVSQLSVSITRGLASAFLKSGASSGMSLLVL